MGRARADIADIEASVATAMEKFRSVCEPLDPAAWAYIETYVAISLRVLRKTNPSRIRDAAMTEEIKARIHRTEIIDEC